MVVRRPSSAVSESMKRVGSTNTVPELRLRSALWARRLRYRLYAKLLPGKPDIVFNSAKLVVFVDGDFWHGNQWKLRGFLSLEDQLRDTRNGIDYWIPKIRNTMSRDDKVNHQLNRMGWTVLRFWESEIKDDLESCVARIERTVLEKKRDK